jgi:hypothetical protein
MNEELDRNQLAMELVKAAHSRPVDTIVLINIACRMALAERARAVHILESGMPHLQKETLDCVVKLRDKIFAGVAEQ